MITIKPFLKKASSNNIQFITNRYSNLTTTKSFEWPISGSISTKALIDQDYINNIRLRIGFPSTKGPEIIWSQYYFFVNNLYELKNRIASTCKTDEIVSSIISQLEANDEISIEVSNNELPFVSDLLGVYTRNRQNIIFIRKECEE